MTGGQRDICSVMYDVARLHISIIDDGGNIGTSMLGMDISFVLSCHESATFYMSNKMFCYSYTRFGYFYDKFLKSGR